MNKTTVYLPDDLKQLVEKAAAREGISEAEVIRRSIAAAEGASRPKLEGALFDSDEVTSERVDELLAGFGEHG
jgi:hypothetical protein